MSLRRRLTFASGIGAALVTSAAALAVVTSQWSAERGKIVETAELLSLDQTDTAQVRDGGVVREPVESGQFAMALVGDEVVATTGNVTDAAGEIAIDDAIDAGSFGEDTITISEFDADGARWATAATTCFDADACTSVAVAVRAPSWGDALAARWLQVALAAAVVTAVASVGAAWLVTRALRPVDAMRSELMSTTASDLSHRVPVPQTGDELEALATTLNDTLDRLEDAVTANQRFTADAAHELRSPLAGIRAAVELRAGSGDDSLLEDTLAEIDRAAALIDDLLLLADGERLAARHEATDLDEVVRNEVAALSLRQGQLSVSVSTEPAHVSVERSTIARVLRNLLDNASQHGNGTLTVGLTAGQGTAVLTVDDNGPGIPDAERARVFDRFVRLDESRNRASGGTGLGLAIVKEVIQAHGGTIGIDDSPDGGARFVVRLPLSSRRSG